MVGREGLNLIRASSPDFDLAGFNDARHGWLEVYHQIKADDVHSEHAGHRDHPAKAQNID